jgi:hypothetical protein
VDTHLLYGAFFGVIGLCEGIFHAIRTGDAGEYDTDWGFRYDDLEGLGVIVGGDTAAEADAFTAALFGSDVSGRDVMTAAEKRLGWWDRMVVLEASRYGSVI